MSITSLDMERKYSQGEWCYAKYTPCDYGVHSLVGDGRDIALVRGDSEEAEANAKLITHAPELLHCCIDTLRILELNPTNDNLYQRNKLTMAIQNATV